VTEETPVRTGNVYDQKVGRTSSCLLAFFVGPCLALTLFCITNAAIRNANTAAAAISAIGLNMLVAVCVPLESAALLVVESTAASASDSVVVVVLFKFSQ
jgi:hypothetical protein